MSLRTRRMKLTSWGRFPAVESRVYEPKTTAELKDAVNKRGLANFLVRGLGRSYGDAALSANGLTAVSKDCSRLLEFDSDKGVMLCDPGIAIGDVMRLALRRGWFPSFTPGTTAVTMGGAVACDVHGKNHHSAGAFSNFLLDFDLTLASGETVSCSRRQNSDLFFATTGGMGLTGIISAVRFSLRKVETAYIKQKTMPAANIDELLSLMQASVPRHEYSVAWLDCLNDGADFGRGVLLLGDHVPLSDLDERLAQSPYTVAARPEVHLPPLPPLGILNGWSMKLFNSVYYQFQRSQMESLIGLEPFFFPLDVLPDWNRLYGPGGFVQYQCVFPQSDQAASLKAALSLIKQRNIEVYLAALKLFGQDEGWLSFPMPGLTLALDMPITRGLWPFLNELDRLVADCGGRVYLAKDSRLSAQAFRAMYPKFPQWLKVKRAVDPANVFASALSRRLKLHED
jgi:decaprenylphospho-beta-D-ribofuranose 2-oxidase